MDEAIDDFKKALALDPYHLKSYDELGIALVEKGQLDEAIPQFQEALKHNPRYAEAHSNLGLTLLRAGRLDEAAGEFQKALDSKPALTASYNGLRDVAWAMATNPKDSLRNGTKAVALAEQVERAANGRQPLFTMTLAAAYAETGRFPEAVAAAERAAQLASSQNDMALANTIQTQLRFYRNNLPFRDTGSAQ